MELLLTNVLLGFVAAAILALLYGLKKTLILEKKILLIEEKILKMEEKVLKIDENLEKMLKKEKG